MQLDTVVIGAGVVGLAVARSLALAGREVTVIERESAIGVATSSRNSGVIHAGIYYACGSLKANLCVRGKELLYEYCERREVPFRRCGKIIVATNREEIATLEGYARSAEVNGAGALRWLSIGEVAAMEPNVRCVSALHSESTGIIDVHTLMQAYQADVEAHNGQVVLRTALRSARVVKSGFESRNWRHRNLASRCRELVNSAGLEAPTVAAVSTDLTRAHSRMRTTRAATITHSSASLRSPAWYTPSLNPLDSERTSPWTSRVAYDSDLICSGSRASTTASVETGARNSQRPSNGTIRASIRPGCRPTTRESVRESARRGRP